VDGGARLKLWRCTKPLAPTAQGHDKSMGAACGNWKMGQHYQKKGFTFTIYQGRKVYFKTKAKIAILKRLGWCRRKIGVQEVGPNKN